MLTPPDAAAAVTSICGAIFATTTGPKTNDGANVLLGLASGGSIAYLLIMAWGLAFNDGVLQSVMRSNSVTLMGALMYAAYMNLRTLPGALSTYENCLKWWRERS